LEKDPLEREAGIRTAAAGNSRSFANSSISVPDTFEEWVEHNLNLAECKWGMQHIGGKLSYEGTMSFSK
jgi:hypothetical protein